MLITVDSLPGRVAVSIDNGEEEKIFFTMSPGEAEDLAILLLHRAKSAKTP